MNNNMKFIENLKTGDVLSSSKFNWIDHMVLVLRDKNDIKVAHLDKRRGKVIEGLSEYLSREKDVKIHHEIHSFLSEEEIIRNVNSYPNNVWGITNNCEHFVLYCLGMKRNSPQLIKISAIIIGFLICCYAFKKR